MISECGDSRRNTVRRPHENMQNVWRQVPGSADTYGFMLASPRDREMAITPFTRFEVTKPWSARILSDSATSLGV